MNRFRDCVLDGPATLEALVVRRPRDAVDAKPLSQQFRFAVQRHLQPLLALSMVVVLLLPGSPTAVLGTVGTVIVNPIQGVETVRTSTHISQEVFIGTTPAITDSDPATPIVAPLFMEGVGAARDHCPPCTVLWCFFTGPRLTVTVTGFATGNSHLFSKASAGFGLSLAQDTTRDNLSVAAITLTQEAQLTTLPFLGDFDDGPPPESLSNMVDRSHVEPLSGRWFYVYTHNLARL